MDTSYWNLFWTTGMPEAWLMSRDEAGSALLPGVDQRTVQGMLGSLSTPSAAPMGGVPGNPKNLY